MDDFEIGVKDIFQDSPAGSWQMGTEFNGKAIATPGSDGAMPPGSGTLKPNGKKAARKAAKSYQNLVLRGRP